MQNKNNSISILGCGWLGLPLAIRLKEQGYHVKGSTTSTEKIAELESLDIEPFRIKLDPQINADYKSEFFDSHILLINIPPSRRQEDVDEYYPKQISELIKMAVDSPLKKILFVGSTSVYPNTNDEVTEDEAGGDISLSGKALLKAEQILHNQNRFQVNILRFCGLYNQDRNPGRFLAGKNLNSSGKDRVNLIHQEDCIRIIMKMIEKDYWGDTYNACSDVHHEKEIFYPEATKKMGLEAPSFNHNASQSYKIVNCDKLKRKLDYEFVYPDPYEAIKNPER